MIIQALLPVFTYFAVGLLLRKLEIASSEHAAFLFRIVFLVTLPALAFQTISDSALTPDSILLPIAGVMVNAICMLAAILYGRVAALPRRDVGAMILGASVTNMVFMFPFVIAMLGPAALAEAMLFDLGNALFVATVAYTVALRYGNITGTSVAGSLLKMLRSPLFIALAAAIVVNLGNFQVPAVVNSVLTPLSGATIPLVLIALGISFSASSWRTRLPLYTVLIRMPLGLVVGVGFVWLAGLQGTMAVVVISAAAAPIGFTSVTLASVARLNTEQVAAALAISVATGMLSAPLLLWAAGLWFGS